MVIGFKACGTCYLIFFEYQTEAIADFCIEMVT